MPDLPPEIFWTIFELVGVSEGRPSVLFRITVAAVCREWKQLIYSNPRPWATLCCNVPEKQTDEDVGGLISRWFSRSGNLPLTLELNSGFQANCRPIALTRFLVRQPRWKSMAFGTNSTPSDAGPFPDTWLHQLFEEASVFTKAQGHSCWGDLRRLRVDHGKLRFREYMKLPLAQIAPNLEDVAINFRRIMNPDILGEPFVNPKALRRLQISAHVPWRNEGMFILYFKTLLEATQLEHLKIHDLYNDEDIPDLPVSLGISFPVRNNAVTSIDLWDSPATRFHLSKLHLPALVSLNLSFPLNSPFDHPPSVTIGSSLRQFIGQSGCSLRALTLDGVVPVQQDLPTLFHSLIKLETLRLIAPYRGQRNFLTNTLALLDEIAPGPPDPPPAPDILPSLHEFTVVDLDILPDLVNNLILSFRKFVEDPRRACDGVVTFGKDHTSIDWKTTGRDKIELRASPAAREGERRFSPLENARLYVGGFEEPLYSRIRKAL